MYIFDVTEVYGGIKTLNVFCHSWMDKLGVSAQRGVGVVMHHTVIGQNGLLDLNLNPTPVCGQHLHAFALHTLCKLFSKLFGQETVCTFVFLV